MGFFYDILVRLTVLFVFQQGKPTDHKEVKNMNQYEVLYVITPELDDEANQSVQDKFAKIITDNGGEIEKTDVWGKRRLAYAIDYKTEGFYVLVNFNANPELPRELERNLRNDERIMRYMVTRKEA